MRGLEDRIRLEAYFCLLLFSAFLERSRFLCSRGVTAVGRFDWLEPGDPRRCQRRCGGRRGSVAADLEACGGVLLRRGRRATRRRRELRRWRRAGRRFA